MTNLRKILEEVYADGLEAELPLDEYNFNQKIQQILALIPKRKKKWWQYDTVFDKGFNQALSEMEQSMTGEK